MWDVCVPGSRREGKGNGAYGIFVERRAQQGVLRASASWAPWGFQVNCERAPRAQACAVRCELTVDC